MKRICTCYNIRYRQYVSIYRNDLGEVYQAITGMDGPRMPIYLLSVDSVQDYQKSIMKYGYMPITTHYVDPSGALREIPTQNVPAKTSIKMV